MPGPMSLAAASTTAVPFAFRRARACASMLLGSYTAAAMPRPISQSPSRLERGFGLCRFQPNSRAPTV